MYKYHCIAIHMRYWLLDNSYYSFFSSVGNTYTSRVDHVLYIRDIWNKYLPILK